MGKQPRGKSQDKEIWAELITDQGAASQNFIGSLPLDIGKMLTKWDETFIREALKENPASVWGAFDSFEHHAAEGFSLHRFVWDAALPTLEEKHGAAFMRDFLDEFFSEGPCRERRGILETLHRKRTNEAALINKAKRLHEYDNNQITHETGGLEDNSANLRTVYEKLGWTETKIEEYFKAASQPYREELSDWLKNCILNRDGKGVAALRNLAFAIEGKPDIIPAKKILTEKILANKNPQLKPRLLLSFCNLLYKNRAIPTRAELNKKVGILRQGETNVPTKLTELGLGVLVER